MQMNNDLIFMHRAWELALKGWGKTSPNPMVGAVLVKRGRIIAEGYHHYCGGDHAEVDAIKNAGKSARGSILYVTLEPCIMCAGAIFWAQLEKLVYGADDKKRGYRLIRQQILHPKTEVESGILQHECSTLITTFFKNKRR